MKVLVTGGRDYTDRERVYSALDSIHEMTPIGLVVHGACHLGGADILAEDWAKSREVDYRGYPAKFKTGAGGKSEGPSRNLRMYHAVKPGLVVAFPGGKGTGGMVLIAKAGNTHVVDFR